MGVKEDRDKHAGRGEREKQKDERESGQKDRQACCHAVTLSSFLVSFSLGDTANV